jgi:hypothetical protein
MQENETVCFVNALGAKPAVFRVGETQEDPVVLLRGGPSVPDYLADVAKSPAPR